MKPTAKAKGQLAGGAPWAEAQKALVQRFTVELGFGNVAQAEPALVPSRAAQLHLSGLIVMADWIASDEKHFDGVDTLSDVTFVAARERAVRAWGRLGLRGGWGWLADPGPEGFAKRFGQDPRPSQRLVMEMARRMEAPGIVVVEAPMGEGKTKAALLAAEILAAKFGADGVFVGMPTQSTSDPMFSQVRKWTGAIDGDLASRVALLHGKRMFNREWRELLEGTSGDAEARFGGVDEYGDCWDDDPYGMGCPDVLVGGSTRSASRGPAEWFLGAKRGLLCPFVVGTIDQLLFAATRTKHVMLRMAGLAGKVVVLDEVHAADVYMSQFLEEGLRWLGQAGVPVVLLSATLPPKQRRELVSAYLAGAAGREEFTVNDLPRPRGYPSVTAAWMTLDGAEQRLLVEDCVSWRDDLNVAVHIMPESIPEPGASREKRRAVQGLADSSVAAYLGRELSNGGCALVIRNTVDRAQTLYAELRKRFGKDVLLLHGRIAVGPRADRTEECLRLLGAPQGDASSCRPSRLIVVATQLAEQSFDVDVDLLVTDLAPIDLLLQRIGRLHRHNGVLRPGGLIAPRVVVTGIGGVEGTAPGGTATAATAFEGLIPRILGASEFIYGRYPLLCAAALVFEAARGERGWRVPAQVPVLVAAGYGGRGEDMPSAWGEEVRLARELWEAEQRERAAKAVPWLLTRRGDREGTTLSGLHYVAVPGGGTDTDLDALVRDGDPSLEAIIVIEDGERYLTVAGRALTANGDVPEDLLDEVLGGTVRLPARYTQDAAERLHPLPGWLGHPRLRYSRAFVLDARRRAVLADRRLRYDEDLGLVEEDMVT